MLKRPLCTLVIVFILYQLFCMWRFPVTVETPLQTLNGDHIACTGTVARREETKDYHIYYLKDILEAPYLEQISDFQLLIYVNKEQDSFQNLPVKTGNVVRFTGTLKTFDPASNPGMFDQRLYYYKQGILASVWAENGQILNQDTNVLLENLTLFRLNCQSILVRELGERNGQFLSAMLLGDKRDMDAEWKEMYQLSGIGHVLAISGLHMSFLGSGIYKFLRSRGCAFWFSALTGCGLLGVYILMIGGGVSCIRAMIMYVVRMGAEIAGRTYDRLTALSIAAAVTIASQPLYLLDAGFLLSYGAILGILFLLPVFEKAQEKRKMKFSGIFASLSIQIAVFPILLYFYFEIPAYSVFLNLLVIPLMTVVMAAGVAGLFLTSLFESLGSCVLQIGNLVLDLYGFCAELSLKLPVSRWIAGKPPVWMIILYYLLLALLYAIWKCREDRKRQYLLNIGSSVLVLQIFLLLFWNQLTCDVQITTLDVGQGDCCVIRTPECTVMIDGGSSDVSSVGKYRIEPFLKSQGIWKIDYVFVSHGDADHTSGVQEMILRQKTGLEIGTLVFPCRDFWDEHLSDLAELARGHGIRIASVNPGDGLHYDDLALRCLQPAEGDNMEPGNAASMVLELAYKDFDMLFTGDVEAEGEVQLMQRLKGKSYDVLKVAHHGSKNSSCAEFLRVVQPRAALISAGKHNFYGHPHGETLERLWQAGSKIYTTSDCGAVTIEIQEKEIIIGTYETK